LVLACELSAIGGQALAECPLPVIGAFIVVASITQTGTAITASRFFHLSGCHIFCILCFWPEFQDYFLSSHRKICCSILAFI